MRTEYPLYNISFLDRKFAKLFCLKVMILVVLVLFVDSVC